MTSQRPDRPPQPAAPWQPGKPESRTEPISDDPDQLARERDARRGVNPPQATIRRVR